ncbi:MAG: type II toxin-antitoxin system PemK/MazF family toxin [Candidatus Marinimicrobia bacterium]|nr:type II toxin-antitoxin system PemK/MazF family toxin [Candidatus Neomarinimicrobiota bacterium]MCK4447580.1 type II toxin-antitoxin system PemK/MazF family toxin [Candidatus Neomarinimicrobiota bacterium]
MVNCSKGDVVLFPYPFSDLTTQKVRPAVVVSEPGKKYFDVFIVPLTSKTENLDNGEFILSRWGKAGLNVKTAVKRGCYLADTDIIRKKVGSLEPCDIKRIESALKIWLDPDRSGLKKYFSQRPQRSQR